MRGECNCGAVSFEISATISDVYICHCSICRRSTGSAGIAVGIVSKDEFKWVTGKDNIGLWSKPGHDWQTSFCVTCGSPLPGKNDDKTIYVPVSLLTTGVSELKVAHHLFVGSKADWEEIGDTGKQHIEGYSE
ncbi:GFA family protein [Exilibacterium tricleocarpae]|uniref:GFA family protein n=1 Tax=Exilibacterium tricleocarpae TaxID=2591008 RepID=A0A545T682_9GAMM|nr:GFA family protein [Exilibacterium tricleocarpae]TQV72736.1 GFA family protein [Exilibacterium tricleocarpae]